MNRQSEVLNAVSVSGAAVCSGASASEQARAAGTYHCKAIGPVESRREDYIRFRDAGDAEGMASIEMEEKWSDDIINAVCTAGKNDALDKYLAGSAYTAAWFIGLISSTSYTATAVTDTMASHAGWLEAGLANAPAYSQGARPTAAWAAASAGSKALTAALTYSITSAGTVKGCFLASVGTKDGTTGIMYSSGVFSGGDKVLSNGDTLSVSYSASL